MWVSGEEGEDSSGIGDTGGGVAILWRFACDLVLLVLGILNANRKIRKRTDTDVAFTREYSRVSIFHRERECTI